MGDNTLDKIIPPATLTDDDINQFFTAITGNFNPRNATSGALEDNQHSLGKATAAWKNLYANNIYINGVLFDPDNVGGDTDNNNAIVSGKVRSTSGMPDFIRASGSGATATILATATSLQITANGTSVTIEADISVTSLTTAPGSNNTCAVNDATLTDQESSKYTGEVITDPLTVTSMGSEISDRVGQYVCLKTPDGEYMFAYVESTTKLSRIFRGFFFDSSGAPIERGTLANSDTLTLMSLGWVFMDSNGTTVDVTYRSPIYSADEPASPAADDYWFDSVNGVWKRYDGSDFQTVSRIPIGLVVIDGTNCVASRSFDFTKAYSDKNDISLTVFSVTQIFSTKGRQKISVYGNSFEFFDAPIIWDITTDLESGVLEASATTYYLYITETGDRVISDQKYYDRRAQLNGYYHPYNSWRCVGEAYNDGSSNLISTVDVVPLTGKFTRYVDFSSSGTFYPSQYNILNNEVFVEVWGAGGGGCRKAGAGDGSGGASGGYARGIVDLTGVASVTVTVGAAGVGKTSSSGDGGAGGNSSFGAYVAASGGGGGINNAAICASLEPFDLYTCLTQSAPGKGTAGDFLLQGSLPVYNSSGTAAGGLGFGGWGGGSTAGNETRVGAGGAGRASADGYDGGPGYVRVWY